MSSVEQEQVLPGVPPFQIPLAVCTKKRFAELTGQELGVVEAQVDRRQLPSVRIGKHRMVNLARLWVDSLRSDDDESGD